MTQTIYTLFDKIIGLVNASIYVIISLALVGFLWGIVRFLASGSSEKLKTEGRQFMMYGVLTLFVMTSMWTIIYLMKDFLVTDVKVNTTYDTNGTKYTTDGVKYNTE